MLTRIVKSKKTDNVKRVSILWDSALEIQGAVAGIKSESRRKRGEEFINGAYSFPLGTEDWLGAPSVGEMNARLQQGWAEGVERLMALPCREAEAQSIRRRRFRAEQGDEVDMQSVWRGDLARAWTRTRREKRVSARTINIVCNVGALFNVPSSDLFWRGASVLRVTAALIEAGYNVGIYGGQCSDGVDDAKKVHVGQIVEVKAPDSPLDLSNLASVLCMAGVFRTALFAGKVVACDAIDRDVTYGLGVSTDALATIGADLGLANMIYQGFVNDQASAEAWIAEALRIVEVDQLQAA